ncbi:MULTISPECIES: hypothetical protein [Paenibacillus]|uniref:Wall-associated protein n=1 Tax=Paenibacillus illinoisensis TaxID=59845 RepID=A0A2W0CBX9_9BACL|nr:hypothetical protein [Paenibacillus illinoisensis]PYY29687.1 Wall-associated protein [Paenibacillus illinoisensis]
MLQRSQWVLLVVKLAVQRKAKAELSVQRLKLVSNQIYLNGTKLICFSQDHIKGGIMKLGKDRLSIFNSVTSKIGKVDPSKIKTGSNQMYAKINGHDVTIRFFADKNGMIINVDAFMGKAKRPLGNLIN